MTNISNFRQSQNAVLVIVSLAIFTDMFSYGVIVPILPRILSQAGEGTSDTKLSILYICYAIGVFVTTPIIGWISDTYRTRQLPMLIGIIGLAFAMLIFAHASSFTLFLLARLFQGISAAATWVIGFAMLADTYSCDDGLGTAVGITMSCSSVGYITGPCLGGILNEVFGPLSPFYFCFGLTLLNLLGRALIRPPNLQNDKTEKNHSYLTVLKDWRLFLVLLTVILSAMIFSAIEATTPDHLGKKFQLRDFWISQLFTAYTGPIILTSTIVGKICDKGYSRIKIISLGLILHALAAPFIAFAPNLTLFILSAILFGGTFSLIATPSMPELANLVQKTGSESYARVYAAYNMAYSIGMIIGPLMIDLIKPSTSLGISLSVISLLLIVYSPLFLFLYTRK